MPSKVYYYSYPWKLSELFMAANNKEEKKLNPFVEGVLGLASLALITVVGFFVFFAFDILLLDFDPIGKLVQLIF